MVLLRQQRQLGTRVLSTEKETLPREAQSWLLNCGQTLRGCGAHRFRRPIQPRAIRGTRGSAQTTEAGSQIIRRANQGPSLSFGVNRPQPTRTRWQGGVAGTRSHSLKRAAMARVPLLVTTSDWALVTYYRRQKTL